MQYENTENNQTKYTNDPYKLFVLNNDDKIK